MAAIVMIFLSAIALTNAKDATPLEEKKAKANSFADLLIDRKFKQATQTFDKTMKKALPAKRLAKIWKETTDQAGEFKEKLGTRSEKYLWSDIIYITCQFENGPLDVKVVYNRNMRISGLWFTPVPQKVLDEYSKEAETSTPKQQESTGDNSHIPWTGKNTSAEAAYITQKIMDRYANMDTFQAVGEIRTDIDKDPKKTDGVFKKILKSITKKPLKSFYTIKMAKPNRYCIEWNANYNSRLSKIGYAWSIGNGSDQLQFNEKKRHERFSNALTTASRMTVQPSLFFNTSMNCLIELRERSRLEDEQVQGVDCYVITGKHLTRTYTYWASKDDFLIHQFRTVNGGNINEAIKEILDRSGNDATPEETAKIKKQFSDSNKAASKSIHINTQTYRNIIINGPIAIEDFEPSKNIEEIREKLKKLATLPKEKATPEKMKGETTKKRNFLTIVADADGELTNFDGNQLEWDELDEILGNLADKKNTVLAVAFKSGIIPSNRNGNFNEWLSKNKTFGKAGQLRQKHGLEYLSFIGQDRPDLRHGPVSIRTERKLTLDKEISLNLQSFEQRPLLNINTAKFTRDNGKLTAKLKLSVTSYPHKFWDIGIRLLDEKGHQIDSEGKNYENSGLTRSMVLHSNDEIEIEFSQIDLRMIDRFEVKLREIVKSKSPVKTADIKTSNTVLLLPKLCLDFATGEMIDRLKALKGLQGDDAEFLKALDTYGRGDLLYYLDRDVIHIGCVRNAKGLSPSPTSNGFGMDVYAFKTENIPAELTVETKEGRIYKVKILKAENDGYLIQYQLVNRKQTTKKTREPEALKSPKGIDKAVTTSDSNIVTLANGVTVELLGICEHPSVGKQWWTPTGDLLKESPYDDVDFGRAFPRYAEKGYKFAVKLSGLAGKDIGCKLIHSEFQTTQFGGLTRPSEKNGIENTKYIDGQLDEMIAWLGTSFLEDMVTCDVQVGISSGDWKSHYEYETDKPNDSVEWALFKKVALKPNFKAESQLDKEKQILKQAESQARLLNHGYISTGHILLALVAENDSVIFDISKDFGITREQVYNESRRLIKKDKLFVYEKTLPLTPDTELTLKKATNLAKYSKNLSVNSRHILHALLKAKDSVAAQVLMNLGLGIEKFELSETLKSPTGIDKAVTTSDSNIVTLDNGVKVELLGICEHPSDGKRWWSPDGTPMKDSPYQKIPYVLNENGQSFEFFAKASSSGQPFELTSFYIEGAKKEGKTYTPDINLPPNYQTIARTFVLPDDLQKSDVKVGIYLEQWQTKAAGKGNDLDTLGSKTYSFSEAITLPNGIIKISLAHDPPEGKNAQRMVAVDKQGNIHKSIHERRAGSAHIEQYQVEFKGITIDEIKEFRFQTRPFRWITFKNVSLKPKPKNAARTNAVD